MSREIILEALNGIRDAFIEEAAGKLGLLAVGAAAAGTAVDSSTLYSLSGTEAATKTGFGAWLAKGGWIALVAGAVAAAGIATGVFFLGKGGDVPPVGSETVETVTEAESRPEGMDTEESVAESESLPIGMDTEEPVTEGETAEPHDIHVFGEWAFDITPTCTEGGIRQRVCTVENCTVRETENWPAGLHNYGDGDTCTLCGYDFGTGSKMSYTSNGDGTCSVYLTNVRVTDLVIPNYSKSGELVVELQEKFASHALSQLSSVVLPDGLRTIGDRAFYNCLNLVSINFPDTLRVIGENAFAGAALQSVQLPEGLVTVKDNAFFSCRFFTEVVIPSTVTELGEAVFQKCSRLAGITFAEGFSMTALPDFFAAECSALTYVNLPETLTSISNDAFSQCASLEMVNIPAGVLSIGDRAFESCPLVTLTIPDGVTSLGESAFAGNRVLKTVTIPASVASIGNYLFSGCSTLTEIVFAENSPITEIPDGFASRCRMLTGMDLSPMTAIGASAFTYTAMTTVTLPEGLTSLGNQAFEGSAITEVVIPASVTEIGNNCFSGCPALQTVTFAEGSALTRIPVSFVIGCPELTAVTLPDTITMIEHSAFIDCPKLSMTEYEGCLYLAMGDNPYAILCAPISDEITSVTSHPDTVHLAGGAFLRCRSLTEVILNEGLISLGSHAFYSCSSLISVQLPSTLKNIGDEAFYSCDDIKELTLPAGLAYIGGSIFDECGVETVRFQGTLADWESMKKHEEWISRTDDYTLICTDGELTVKP